jgi:hypothetical protein
MTKYPKIIYDGFEGKTLSDIWSDRKLVPYSIKFQSKIVRKGKSALKITIRKGDRSEVGDKKSPLSERDELTERSDLWTKENEEWSYSFSIYLPKNFPIVPVRLVLAQWKQLDPKDDALINNPIMALRYVNGELTVTLQITEERIKLIKITDEIRGKWLDFKFDIKFARTAKGFVKVSLNNRVLCKYNGITAYSGKYGYPKNGRYFFKIGLYRDTMEKPMTAYFDEYKKEKINSKK